MGRRLDALLGRRRRFNTSELKSNASLAVSRVAVLKNKRQTRCSNAQSDVVQYLNSNNFDGALLRVELVIKEQNMVDVFVVLEGYCHLLLERLNFFEQEKDCPEELIEAVSSLIYAAARCGEFPELQELRRIFTSRFGKEFVARAVELRNNCGVNPRIIQKLSTRMPSLEAKMRVLNKIASDNNIDLPIQDTSPHDNTVVETKEENVVEVYEERERTPRRKYKDVADAAQAAFESAAYAAAAARAAVELSRSESTDPDHPNTPPAHVSSSTIQPKKGRFQDMKTESEIGKTMEDEESSGSSSDNEDEEIRNIAVFDKSDNEKDDEIVEERSTKSGELGMDMEKRSEGEDVEPLNIHRRPISVRTTWAQRR